MRRFVINSIGRAFKREFSYVPIDRSDFCNSISFQLISRYLSTIVHALCTFENEATNDRTIYVPTYILTIKDGKLCDYAQSVKGYIFEGATPFNLLNFKIFW